MDTDDLIRWIQEQADSVAQWWSDNDYDPEDTDGSPESDEMHYAGNAQIELLTKLSDMLGVTPKIRWPKT